jgi:hypothetical protein
MNNNQNFILGNSNNKTFGKLVYVLAVVSLLLSFGLVLCLIIIYNYSLPQTTNQIKSMQGKPPKPSLTPAFTRNYTTLAFNPTPATLKVGQTKNINLLIDTGANMVTGLQFVLKYDPRVLEIVSIAPAGFYDKPTVLLNKKDQAKGTYEYAVGTLAAKTGNGNLITLTIKGLSLGSTQITINETKVADKNEMSNNVFKSGESVGVEVL